jgi:YugN-like family
MIEMPSRVEGKEYRLYDLEQRLKPIGYSIGGNWDYDHGYFDYKIDDTNGYQFFRVPFEAVDGQLDSNGCTVALGRPFLLSHQYEDGLDNEVDSSNASASFNQFQEPENKDAKVPDKYMEIGRALVSELEMILLDT